jgi:hypothetical protein
MTTKNIPEDELLPCPFCGAKPRYERLGNARRSCIIVCDYCGCTLETGEVFDCGHRWNTRKTSNADMGVKV